MARKQDDSINVSIFMALKVAETSGVPVLFMSNPGVGKTTSVEMYAKLRGMEVVTLRGNSESPETIHGYETVGTKDPEPGKPALSTRTRPTWMNHVLENKKNGKRTLLFLDELTTAPEHVQSALLQVVFGKQCGVEFLPDDTFIVAAGNYMNNLSSAMIVLPPMLNRFMIFNITPEIGDLATFLCKYKGAAGSSEGKCVDHMVTLEKQLRSLDKQASNYDEKTRNIIGENFEICVRETTSMLIKNGMIDLANIELSGVFSDVENTDPNLYGFVTLRTLNYLRDVAIATYINFGKPGITSDNFLHMIDGLCGISMIAQKKSEPVKQKLGREYFKSFAQVAADLDKLQCTSFAEFSQAFTGILGAIEKKISAKNVDLAPEIISLGNKIDELQRDKDVSKLDKPIDVDIVNKIITTMSKSVTTISNFDKIPITNGTNIPVEDVCNLINRFNSLCDVTNKLNGILTDPKYKYAAAENDALKSFVSSHLQGLVWKIRSMKKAITVKDEALAGIIPEIKNINTNA